jgi:hypothetical protein
MPRHHESTQLEVSPAVARSDGYFPTPLYTSRIPATLEASSVRQPPPIASQVNSWNTSTPSHSLETVVSSHSLEAVVSEPSSQSWPAVSAVAVEDAHRRLVHARGSVAVATLGRAENRPGSGTATTTVSTTSLIVSSGVRSIEQGSVASPSTTWTSMSTPPVPSAPSALLPPDKLADQTLGSPLSRVHNDARRSDISPTRSPSKSPVSSRRKKSVTFADEAGATLISTLTAAMAPFSAATAHASATAGALSSPEQARDLSGAASEVLVEVAPRSRPDEDGQPSDGSMAPNTPPPARVGAVESPSTPGSVDALLGMQRLSTLLRTSTVQSGEQIAPSPSVRSCPVTDGNVSDSASQAQAREVLMSCALAPPSASATVLTQRRSSDAGVPPAPPLPGRRDVSTMSAAVVQASNVAVTQPPLGKRVNGTGLLPAPPKPPMTRSVSSQSTAHSESNAATALVAIKALVSSLEKVCG